VVINSRIQLYPEDCSSTIKKVVEFQDGHLFEYPLSIDASTNMMTLTVANKIYVYFLGPNQEWKQKSFLLESQGEYSGYMAASVAGGHVLVAQTMKFMLTTHQMHP
jgi:hypothetical protein